jgi:hypothetical protein
MINWELYSQHILCSFLIYNKYTISNSQQMRNHSLLIIEIISLIWHLVLLFTGKYMVELISGEILMRNTKSLQFTNYLTQKKVVLKQVQYLFNLTKLMNKQITFGIDYTVFHQRTELSWVNHTDMKLIWSNKI